MKDLRVGRENSIESGVWGGCMRSAGCGNPVGALAGTGEDELLLQLIERLWLSTHAEPILCAVLTHSTLSLHVIDKQLVMFFGGGECVVPVEGILGTYHAIAVALSGLLDERDGISGVEKEYYSE